MNHHPPSLENNIRGISISFVKNSRGYLQVKVHHLYIKKTAPAAYFATGTAGVVDTKGKLPPVSKTVAVNLPPVLTTPVANI
jgi:hypothetical protein